MLRRLPSLHPICNVSLPPVLSLATSISSRSIHGFTVQSTLQVPELQLLVTQLSHDNTGAKHVHFARQDSNNVFGVGFRTPVNDSTGVPHILEHIALCGSKKYPIRDPFFKMLQRSLSTFMNAMTYQDLTLYPFATQNPIDFRNLMSVYMNVWLLPRPLAVFEPNLKRLDFAQEGWRLEHANLSDPSSKLEFKGVVYNEMKGAMSGIHSQFAAALNRHLFPDSIYAPNSGGDPADITSLTWEQLKQFHRLYYSPSNAQFLTYGDFPLEGTLEFIDRSLSQLSPADWARPTLGIKDLPTFNQPKIVHESSMVDPMGDPIQQARFCLAWGCNDVIKDAYTTTALSILSKLLLDGSSSPMQQALIDSSLAPDYSPVIGYDSSLRRGSFTIGVQGIRADQIPKIEETIWRVLEKVSVNGFPNQRIDAIIHQMELSMRHVTASFGINLVQNFASSIIQGSNLADIMSITKHLRRIDHEAKHQNLFQRLVKEYLIDNSYRVALTMTPDAEYAVRADKEESDRLATIVKTLSLDQRKQIYQDGLDLIKSQESVQDVSILPCLSLNEVPRDTPCYPIEQVGPSLVQDQHVGQSALHPSNTTSDSFAGIDHRVFVRKAPTNGVSYISTLANLDHLDKDLIDYLPLFSSALSWQGTHKKEMDVLDQELRLYTGGVGMAPKIRTSLDGKSSANLEYCIGGNALTSNVSHLTRLMSELSFETKFNRLDRLKNLIAGNISSMMNGLADRGHSLAMSLAASMVLPSYAISERWNGISQLKFLSKLQTKEEAVINKLQMISAALKTSEVKHLIVSQAADVSKAIDHLPTICNQFDSKAGTKSNPPEQRISMPEPKISHLYVPMPSFSVNYCAKAIKGVPYLEHKSSVSLNLAARIMTYKYLHREIREKGGAYGGGASYSPIEGVFLMYSYRDPRRLETIADFDHALHWFQSGAVTDQDLMEAKLSTFGVMDRPIDAGSQGSLEFGLGIDRRMLQMRRDILFEMTVEDVIAAVEEVLVVNNNVGNSCNVVIGGNKAVGNGWRVYE